MCPTTCEPNCGRPPGPATPYLTDLSPLTAELSRVDACFFCLGVSSAGMSEADYAKLTYDLALGVARELVAINAGMTFVYVSGMGTDSSERGGRCGHA